MNLIYKALADKNRRKIIRLLQKEDMAVNQLLKHFEITQATLSNHLAILRKAGLIAATTKGKQRIYRADKYKMAEFIKQMENKFVTKKVLLIDQEIKIRCV